MKLEEYKAMTPFEQSVYDSVMRMEQYLKAIYNLLAADEAERHD